MERRFTEVWNHFEERRESGESFAIIIKSASTPDLVAALAAAGSRDAIAANAIATELLNRERRAPFYGAFLVSATVAVAMFFLDWYFTGTPIPITPGRVSTVLFPLVALTAGVSYVTYVMWRGGLPRLRMALQRKRDF